jgi:hypothetical protein
VYALSTLRRIYLQNDIELVLTNLIYASENQRDEGRALIWT